MDDNISRLQSTLTAMLDQLALTELATQAGIKQMKTVRRAAHFALPTVLENMGNLSRSAGGPSKLTELRHLVAENPTEGGAKTAQQLFGGRLPRAGELLAQKVGIEHVSGLATLHGLSAWTLGAVWELAENDPTALTALLADHGAQAGGHAHLAKQQPAASVEPIATQPEPRIDSAPVEKVAAPAATAGEGTNAPETRDGPSPKLIGACVAALLVLLGIGFALFGGGGGEDAAEATDISVGAAPETLPAVRPAEDGTGGQAQPTPPAAAQTSQAEETETTETQAANDTTTAPTAVPVADSMLDPALATLSVPMRDIKDVSSSASGTVDFTFNKLTGEICFAVGSFGVDAPYAAHIHAGDFGVKGGVVADLGMLEDQASGCIDNLPADTLAILAQPSRHYAELHDAGGEWTVRGQLSETMNNPGIVPFVIPMRDILGTSPNSSGVLSFDFNTLTGEVCYSVIAVGVSPPFDGHIHAGGFGIKGGVVLDLGGLDNGNTGCVQNDLADTLAILADPNGHYAELHDASGEWTVRGQLTETIDNPGVVSWAVPMVDIKDVEPSAAGTLHFDFNTVTGEICYDVSAVNITAPFDGHIHAGTYGVKGGVVLDLGGLEDGSGGCVSNQPADTLAILADPAGHYAELHDAGGVWTIRGQLSEATAAIDPDAINLLVVDASGGGASIRLEDGTIYLEGEVSDQAVMDEMTDSLDGISTPVVNNLSIVAGSPIPSGRVIVGDNVFFDTGSDQVKALQVQTVAALVELAESRPDWIMTIVGHTDNIGTDVYNLELSLRRAEAIRDVLVTQGMNSDNMRIRGAGETAPIADNGSEAGRSQNRRIEFEFTPA